jgi:hypothetical protein
MFDEGEAVSEMRIGRGNRPNLISKLGCRGGKPTTNHLSYCTVRLIFPDGLCRHDALGAALLANMTVHYNLLHNATTVSDIISPLYVGPYHEGVPPDGGEWSAVACFTLRPFSIQKKYPYHSISLR